MVAGGGKGNPFNGREIERERKELIYIEADGHQEKVAEPPLLQLLEIQSRDPGPSESLMEK